MRIRALFALITSLVCSFHVFADTRVELMGRVDFNGLALGNCLNPPCPWQHVRPGEYVHVTFLVDNSGLDISANWPPCNPVTVIGDTVYNIRNGTMVARAAGVSLSVPVSLPPSGTTVPAFRMVSDNCTVDAIELSGVLTRGGRCCYPNGSCTFVVQTNCGGAWTVDGVCAPTENSCAPATGACCAVDNTCSITLPADCTGTWAYGPCTVGQCPQLAGACCELNGACIVTTQANCAAAWSQGLGCSTDVCAWPTLQPDYAMDMTLRGPRTMFTSAVITDNLGYYPASVWAPDHSWIVLFQNTEMFIYYQTTMAFQDDTVAMGSCCPGDGHCLLTSQVMCPNAASWVSGGLCTPATCPAGSGACCMAEGTCQLMSGAACAAIANAVYQLDGSACGPGVCPPTGACCSGGSCSIILQSACTATGGSWLGADSRCTVQSEYAAALTIVAGKCCAPNGSCTLKYQTSCTGVGYTFTPNSLCNVPCENAGACCNVGSGACTMVTPSICDNTGGVWTGATTCEGACFDVGVCCNATSGSCIMVLQVACQGGNVWTQGGTCSVPCVAAAGKCCNTSDGSCAVVTQTFCSGTWTAGATCESPCVSAGTILPDAVFNGPNGTWTNTLAITDPQTVQSVEVWLDISMSRTNDLKVRLTGPNGTTVDLFSRIESKPPLCQVTPIGPGHTMFGVYTFQDSAPQSFYDHVVGLGLGSGLPTAPGRYRAAGCGGTSVWLNAAFAGLSAAGDWTLTMIDERSGVNATLRSWGVSFNGGVPAPCAVGKCVVGTNCTATTFAQCNGTWSLGPCTSTGCTSGTPGACCFLDTCTVVCSSLCPSGAQFVGSGTTCSASACLTACCRSDGSCVLATPFACAGTPGTSGSTCSPNTCPQPVACCRGNGECTFGLPSSCTGGTAGAPGSACTPNTCSNPNPPPANDLCAAVLVGGPDVVLSNNVWTSGAASILGATGDAASPSCGSGMPAADVWWRFVPPNTGSYLISTCGNPVWDTTVSVWSNCATQITGGCADDNCSSSASSSVYGHENLTAQLAAGTPYLIRVGSFSPLTSNPGAFTLNVSVLGACCNTLGVCALTTQSACTGSRVFQGVFTVCTPNPCPQPRACCSSQNACSFIVASACTGDSTVGPEGSTCSPNPCGMPAACCYPDGSCEFLVWPVCTGERQLMGTVCPPNPCPQPSGACCTGSTCVSAAAETCTGANSLFAGSGTVCNVFGVNNTSPCCLADYNHLGGVTVQDIFDFLSGYFTQSPLANVNGVGGVTVQDIFDFLSTYFAGC